MPHKALRKRLFVSRDIQGKILWRLVGYWVVYHLVLWHALFLIQLQRHYYMGAVAGIPRASVGELYVRFAQEYWIILAMSAAMFPAVLRNMLYLTHQVAGPLVRFREVLRKLARGERVEKIKLRPGDLLTEFQDAFNEFLESDRMRQAPSSDASRKPEAAAQEGLVLEDVAGLRAELLSAGCNAATPVAAR